MILNLAYNQRSMIKIYILSLSIIIDLEMHFCTNKYHFLEISYMEFNHSIEAWMQLE